MSSDSEADMSDSESVMSSDSEVSDARWDSKRLKSPEIDRISALPETLIVHILSLLPTIDKIRTGALSRRWRNLWTCVPKLSFDWTCAESGPVTGDDFVNCVNKILFLILLNGGAKVKEFVVKWPYEGAYANDIQVWTRFAIKNETEIFELDFDPDVGQFCELPQIIYTNSFFRELLLTNCNFIIRGSVSWNSLKKLTITYGAFSNEALEVIVAGSPALEFLELCLDAGISSFDFRNSSLKEFSLFIHYWLEEEQEDAAFQILAPSVQSLQVSGHFRTCKLLDMTSLVEASLFGRNVRQRLPEYPILTQEVLYSLSNVQTLTLGTWVIQGLAMLPTEDGRPLFPKCKCLTIDTQLWKDDPNAIASVLKCAPEVETLIVTISNFESKPKFLLDPGHGNSDIDQFWTSKEMGSDYLARLTTVKFNGFWVYRRVAFAFVQFLLKNARGLQKVIIYMDTKDISSQAAATVLFETVEKLSGLPKSSPDAKLFIHP